MARRRQLVFSLTKKDFKITPYKGSGAGGQKRNKTSNACRITHESSGAVGECEQERSFEQNKKIAFRRMTESSEFKAWMELQKEIIRGNVKYEEMDESGKFKEKTLTPGE